MRPSRSSESRRATIFDRISGYGEGTLTVTVVDVVSMEVGNSSRTRRRDTTSARDAVSAAAIGPTDRGVPELNLPALHQPGLKMIAIDSARDAG